MSTPKPKFSFRTLASALFLNATATMALAGCYDGEKYISEAECSPGLITCECAEGDACLSGLSCISNVCVDLCEPGDDRCEDDIGTTNSEMLMIGEDDVEPKSSSQLLADVTAASDDTTGVAQEYDHTGTTDVGTDIVGETNVTDETENNDPNDPNDTNDTNDPNDTNDTKTDGVDETKTPSKPDPTKTPATVDKDGTCGNKTAEASEECDDGNDDNEDACTNKCKDAVCGDGHQWTKDCTGEQCEFCDDDDPKTCSSMCTEPGSAILEWENSDESDGEYFAVDVSTDLGIYVAGTFSEGDKPLLSKIEFDDFEADGKAPENAGVSGSNMTYATSPVARNWQDAGDCLGDGCQAGFDIKILKDESILVVGSLKQETYVGKYDDDLKDEWIRNDYTGSAFSIAGDGDELLVSTIIGDSDNSNHRLMMLEYNEDGGVEEKTPFYEPDEADQTSSYLVSALVADNDDGDTYFAGSGYTLSQHVLLAPADDPKKVQAHQPADGIYRIQDLAVDSDGNPIVAGQCIPDAVRGPRVQAAVAGPKVLHHCVIKYSSASSDTWTRTGNGEDAPSSERASAHGLAIDEDDNIVVAGYAYKDGSARAWVRKYDEDGDVIWDYYNPTDDTVFHDVAIDEDGFIYAVGSYAAKHPIIVKVTP